MFTLYLGNKRGSGSATHDTSGALIAQDATIAGASAHATLHTSTGALAAQAATIAGTAAHEHVTTGALVAQDATIAGSADHTTVGASHSTSGALVAQDATLAGSAEHLTLHTTSGALAAQASTVAGVAAHQHVTTGALAADTATVSGAAAHLTLHATSGALTSQAATISGAAEHSTAGAHDAAGVLAAGDAIIVGFALRSGGAPGPGFFNEASGLPGATAKSQPRVPRVKAPKARAVEPARTTHDCTGALVAGSASISGMAELAALLVQDGLYRSVPKPPMQRSSNEERIAFLEREVSTLRRALNGLRGT